jgi:hypothetical protein
LREKGGHGRVIGRGVINSSATDMQIRVRVIFVEAMRGVRRWIIGIKRSESDIWYNYSRHTSPVQG